MRYSTALIAFLWSIASVVKPQIVGELNLQNFELPEAIMLYDIIILRKNTQPNIGCKLSLAMKARLLAHLPNNKNSE